MTARRPQTRPTAVLRKHEQAERVPSMTREEYDGLLADIRTRGITTPLEITADDRILDGRHRHDAALALGLATVPIRLVEPANELEHMLLAAVHRRHLTASQRAALVVELDGYRQARAESKERQRANLRVAERATLPARERPRERAARFAGVSPRTIEDAAAVHGADPTLFEAVKAGKIPAHRAAKQLRRAQRLSALSSAPPLPDGPFQVVYADPPWRSPVPGSEWAPEAHYETMTTEEIKALRVPVADDAILFLWAVNSQLPDALEVMAAWGFEYRTNLVWVKNWIGLGQWARNRHELLFVGRRGNFPLPDEPDRPDSVVEAPKRRHSEKPVVFYELIERMYPDAARIELFARQQRRRWIAWGNEVAA